MVLGLVRDMVVAAVFGAAAELDAFLVSQGLMNLVLGLLAGAVAKSAVPVLARDAVNGETGRAARTVSRRPCPPRSSPWGWQLSSYGWLRTPSSRCSLLASPVHSRRSPSTSPGSCSLPRCS
jgi:hypothetical protein